MPSSSEHTLQQVIDSFIAERIRGEEWALRTIDARKSQLSILSQILGSDCDIASIGNAQTAKVKKILQDIPKHMNKKAETKGLPLMEAIEVPDLEKLSVKTVNEYIGTYNSLFFWAEKQGFIEKNPFKGLIIKHKKKKKDAKDSFSPEQMRAILNELENYQPSRKNPSFKYWGTMIAIYTGARLNEICQLYLTDIKQDDNDIWYFHFNDKNTDTPEGEEKKLKTEASARRVPIHNTLLSLGLLEYIGSLHAQKQKRLFPELTYAKGHGYGRKLGKWVNTRFLEDLKIKRKGLSFQSFRHTFITELMNNDVSLGMAQDIVGHSKQNVLESVYNKGYTLPVLQSAINKLSYTDQ